MSDSTLFVSELERLSNQPKSILSREYWFPLALFGVISMGAGAVFGRWDPAATSSWIWWAVLGPLGGMTTGWWFYRRSETAGIRVANPWIYTAIGVATAVGCAASGVLVTAPWTSPAVMGVVGVAMVAMAVVDRIALLAVVGFGMACLGVVAGLGDLSASTFSLVIGVFMVGAAAALKIWQ